MRTVESLRDLTAGTLLSIWHTCREQTEDPLERVMLCNARILMECCFAGGQPVYGTETEVLEDLTPEQMEELMLRLSGGAGAATEVNPAFDRARFEQLRKE